MGNEIVYIHAGWLIDGSGAAAQSAIQLSLTDGTIRSIRKMPPNMPDSAGSDMPVLDFSDCTLLPGLIDCHVHLALSPGIMQEPSAGRAFEGYHGVRRRILKHLHQLLVRGILAVRDGGDRLVHRSLATGFFVDHGRALRRRVRGRSCLGLLDRRRWFGALRGEVGLYVR